MKKGLTYDYLDYICHWLAKGRCLDGAMGTILKPYRLPDLRISQTPLLSQDSSAAPCDLLSLSHPEIVLSTHRLYIQAGAEIISTNTFNSNANSFLGTIPADHHLLRELNLAGARLAREATAGREDIKVAGVIGPGRKRIGGTLNRIEISRAYACQAEALIEGGADMLMLETVYNLPLLKAAIETMPPFPLMISFAVSTDGRLASGEDIREAISAIADRPNVVSVGLNCIPANHNLLSLIHQLRNSIGQLSPSGQREILVSCHPNAGIPDEAGRYGITPDRFGAIMQPLLSQRLIDIAGGCCGTTPRHIARLR